MAIIGAYYTLVGEQQAYRRIIWMGKKVFMPISSFLTNFSDGGEPIHKFPI